VKAMHDIKDWGLQPQNRQHVLDNFSYEKRLEQLQAFYEFAVAETASA